MFCMQLTKAYVAKISCNQLLIDFATSLLTIYLPILNSIAMSLYDIITVILNLSAFTVCQKLPTQCDLQFTIRHS